MLLFAAGKMSEKMVALFVDHWAAEFAIA